MLKQLNKLNKRVFISSLTPKDTLNKIIEKRGLSRLIEYAYGTPTTNVEHLKDIQLSCRVDKNKIAFVGDSVSDLYVSNRFGCDFIGIGRNPDIFG